MIKIMGNFRHRNKPEANEGGKRGRQTRGTKEGDKRGTKNGSISGIFVMSSFFFGELSECAHILSNVAKYCHFLSFLVNICHFCQFLSFFVNFVALSILSKFCQLYSKRALLLAKRSKTHHIKWSKSHVIFLYSGGRPAGWYMCIFDVAYSRIQI